MTIDKPPGPRRLKGLGLAAALIILIAAAIFFGFNLWYATDAA